MLGNIRENDVKILPKQIFQNCVYFCISVRNPGMQCYVQAGLQCYFAIHLRVWEKTRDFSCTTTVITASDQFHNIHGMYSFKRK